MHYACVSHDPCFGVFYGGLSRRKNVVNTMIMAFQLAFAAITAAIITGSLAGRMKFVAVIAFVAIWSVVVYAPLAHMVWGGDGSFIGDKIGALDFAGGDVVHISSGLTGLVLAVLLGKRRGFGMMAYRPHNVPFVLLGAGLLWFGWFGFNAGSAFAADAVAALALLNTMVAPAAAMLAWMLVEAAHTGKATLVGACTGVVTGLVAITPAAGFVDVWAAVVMGVVTAPSATRPSRFSNRVSDTTMHLTLSGAIPSAAS